MAVSIYSALKNLDAANTVDLYILDGGISVKNKRCIEKVVEGCNTKVSINWKKIHSKKLSGLSVKNSWLSTSAYLRLWIPEIVPDAYSRAIYLDSDLVVEGCLSELWREPFDNKALLAVRDYWIPFVSSPKGVYNFNKLGLNPKQSYFNSGVLVFNLVRWREESLSDNVIRYLYKHSEDIVHEDQESLNAVLANDWKELNLTWNIQQVISRNGWVRRVENMRDSDFKRKVIELGPRLLMEANIIHFVTAAKPWKETSHYDLQRRWYKYFWESGWLSPVARLQSQVRFYTKYYTMAVAKALREGSRPARHRLAAHAPKRLRWLLRSDDAQY